MTPWPEGDPKSLDRAARVIRRGGVLLYPTATVYGLGCDLEDAEALTRIRRLKGRDQESPLLVLTDDWERTEEWVTGLTDAHRRLMARIPPLALTLLLEAKEGALEAVRGDSPEIGVRATADSFCRALIRRAGTPIVSTSANPSGGPAPSRFEEVASAILEAVDGAVETRRELGGTASTVARIREGKVEVLRPGAVAREELERLIGGGSG